MALRQPFDFLWDEVLHAVKRCKKLYDSQLLDHLAPLLQAALSCKHRNVKNKTIEFWNQTFGTAEKLQYPPALVETFQTIKEKVDIVLPCWYSISTNSPSFSGESSVISPSPSVMKLNKVRLKPTVDPPAKKIKVDRKEEANAPPFGGLGETDSQYVEIPANLPHEKEEEQLLTERQQEKQEQKCPKYSSLELTQDALSSELHIALHHYHHHHPVVEEKPPLSASLSGFQLPPSDRMLALSVPELLDLQLQLTQLLNDCSNALKTKLDQRKPQ
jgi:hypothetical protein